MEPKFYFGHFDVGFQGVLFSHFHQKRSKEYDHHSSWPRVESYPTVLSFDYTFPPNIEGHPSFEFPLLSHIAMFLENFKLYQSLQLLTFNSRNFSPGSAAQARETAGAEASTPQWPWKVHSAWRFGSIRLRVVHIAGRSPMIIIFIMIIIQQAGFRSRLAKTVIPLLEMLELFWRLVDETTDWFWKCSASSSGLIGRGTNHSGWLTRALGSDLVPSCGGSSHWFLCNLLG